MIVSWNWLKDYVPLDVPPEEVARRLTLSGLNLESMRGVGGDIAMDLEVTSNRPDCLGHIGVAREIAVLCGRPLTIPPAEAAPISQKTSTVTSVENACPDLCPQYFARVIRGVNVRPSPGWLQARLATLGIASINNVVDVTNYVLMECGQPLHAFDFEKLADRRIIVRRARAGETITAINQRRYELTPDVCVIADARRPVAVGGVMGGLDTEIGPGTKSVLIETAAFAPLSIRNTARRLNLHSDSSYRFERGVDPLGLDWASRRCCELILQLAGGELLDEAVFAGERPPLRREPISLRFAQIPRLLGIEIPAEEAVRTLTALGLKPTGAIEDGMGRFEPPSWRADLEREIDLIEEVARIHGYDRIPEDVPVPVVSGGQTLRDRVTDRVRDLLTAAGFYEAVTLSFVSQEQLGWYRPFGEQPPLQVEHSSRRHENLLRQSLIPSLLTVRRENERHGTFDAEVFEIARVYRTGAGPDEVRELSLIGLVSGRSFADMKGVVESLARSCRRDAVVSARPCAAPEFVAGRGAELLLDEHGWGWLGELDRRLTDRLDLRDEVTVAELDLDVLVAVADLTPLYRPLPQFPAVERDLNFVLDESVAWQDLYAAVRAAGGELVEAVSFGGQYRGPQIGPDKKSYVVTITYRSAERTLTNEEVEAAQQRVIAACQSQLAAQLR